MGLSKLLVGLGNPGRQYEFTRHNIGFMVLMELARSAGADWKKSRQASALTAEYSEGGENIGLLLPLTFMNNSGQAVRDTVHFNKIGLENILVVADDIRLDFGVTRLKPGGSDGGHNGLKSVALEMGSVEYPRLRLGVSAPPPGMDQADYVLSEFNIRERNELGCFVKDAADCCRLWIKGEMSRAMTQYNLKKGKKHNE
ncbi:MAG: aminoacyl-tRNA hydrolase [Candidatus Omnitrophica bacterium]|nr:aminoacyl-tRNA hydrolase [Candidatus Omnitrophota bacterium]